MVCESLSKLKRMNKIEMLGGIGHRDGVGLDGKEVEIIIGIGATETAMILSDDGALRLSMHLSDPSADFSARRFYIDNSACTEKSLTILDSAVRSNPSVRVQFEFPAAF